MRRKLRARWFFDVSKVKESSFFLNRTSLTPHQIFDAHLLKTIWVRWFYSLFKRMRLERKRTMFIQTNQPLITSFYIKKVPIFAELAISQRWSAIFCATGAWGGKPIGRVRVNLSEEHKWKFPLFFARIIYHNFHLKNILKTRKFSPIHTYCQKRTRCEISISKFDMETFWNF